jgi:hypothetical protein
MTPERARARGLAVERELRSAGLLKADDFLPLAPRVFGVGSGAYRRGGCAAQSPKLVRRASAEKLGLSPAAAVSAARHYGSTAALVDNVDVAEEEEVQEKAVTDREAGEAAADWLPCNMTVIITTSPARSDPDVDLLRATLASLDVAGGGLAKCHRILVCDHFDSVEEETRSSGSSPLGGPAHEQSGARSVLADETLARAEAAYATALVSVKSARDAGMGAGLAAAQAAFKSAKAQLSSLTKAGQKSQPAFKPKPGEHRGLLPAEQVERYRQRIKAFRQSDVGAGVEVLELAHWHGFGLATQRALQLVKTPLVCVVQHDLAFTRPVRLDNLGRVILSQCSAAGSGGGGKAAVNFVALPKPSSAHYRERLRARSKLEVGDAVLWPVPGEGASQPLTLTRVPQFFDGTHVASAEWYRGIFGCPLLDGKPISRGQFTEDNLGQHMLQKALQAPQLVAQGEGLEGEGASCDRVSQGVLDVVAEFGGWMWTEEGLPPPIFHLDGRIFLSAEERKSRGIPEKDLRYRIAAAAATACAASAEEGSSKKL